MALQYGKGATAKLEPLEMLQTGRGTREIKEKRAENRTDQWIVTKTVRHS
jgi:hypothetical protein